MSTSGSVLTSGRPCLVIVINTFTGTPFHDCHTSNGTHSKPSYQHKMAPAEMTLIVAATRNMGIGLNGSMPWSGLRKEIQYFARVTTRVPPTVGPWTPHHFKYDSIVLDYLTQNSFIRNLLAL